MNNEKHVLEEDLKHICNNLDYELGEMSGKSLLIAGGAGFLGYYLVQTILHWNNNQSDASKINLVVYDNFMRGIPLWLENLSKNRFLKIIKHDVIDDLPDNIEDFQFIIHAATIASPTYYRKHPIETMDANINGLRHFLDYCINQRQKNKPVEGFLFFSTSEIYGDPTPENIPTPETYRGNVSCTGPRACYDESKRYGETLCVNFAQQFNLPIKIARPFNNYGPGLKISDRRALPDFARNILNNEDIVLYSDGSPTRTFCYVADAIVGYFKVLIKGKGGESYNIGMDRPEISILELAKKTIEISQNLFKYKGKLIMKISDDIDYLTDNPNRRCPVITKAKKDLGFNPSIDLNEGILRSLLWYQSNSSGEDL
jgi:nucleoside-diphosphate-sugar epimerase